MSVPHLSPVKYNSLIKKIRSFFDGQGYLESYLQNRVDVLTACEDPSNLITYKFCDGLEYPMCQTNQMRLELELLKGECQKLYCVTTSYRAEPRPVPGRHNYVFPMFEFESVGGFDNLITIEEGLLRHLGFGGTFPKIDYEEVCRMYKTHEVTHEHEARLERDFGPVVFLQNFPSRTSPFFNMRQSKADCDLYKKIDVIVGGQETIGSAERETDVGVMRKNFYEISDGEYSKTLFEKFGKERVEKELEEYLGCTFVARYGAGCGLTRLLTAMEKYGL